jgi:hypothetical protein
VGSRIRPPRWKERMNPNKTLWMSTYNKTTAPKNQESGEDPRRRHDVP